MNKLISIFRSFKYRNFKLFFPCLIIGQIGIWFQNTAMGWIVYELTKSPFTMGLIMCCNMLPLFIMTPFAGVIIDKFSKHKLLILIQICFAVQALILTVLTLTGQIRIWNIILLGIFLNIIAAIDAPLRQSIYIYLINDKNDLGNAISLNSTCINIARFIGPAISGIVITSLGEAVCFLMNFLCFIPAAILAYYMNIKEEKSEQIKNMPIFWGLKKGIKYISNDSRIILLLTIISTFCFIGMIYPMLMPIYTKDLFYANADVLGYLMSAAGAGAFVTSLCIACKYSIKGFKLILCSGLLISSICFILLGFSKNINLSIILMFFFGCGISATIISNNTLTQSITDNDKRGRVMSIHALCFFGTTSIGSILAGTIAQHLGINLTLIILGLMLFISSFYFFNKLKNMNFQK